MKIGALVLTGGKIRPNSKRVSYNSQGFLGMEIVLDELRDSGLSVEYCTMPTMHLYDVVFWSITAQEDIVTFLTQVAGGQINKGKAVLIVGGAGCINVAAIYDYIDVAVFGRAEDIVLDILNGAYLPSVWRKTEDHLFEGKYKMRQATRLDDREGGSVGCRNKCYFCHYSWTHKLIGDKYNPTQSALAAGSIKVNEDDFRDLILDKPGRYTTAFDGMSEQTRCLVNKGFVTDELILTKLQAALALGLDKAIMLKIFSIAGYPWETLLSVREDVKKLGELFKGCIGAGTGRIMGAIHITPFSPEPLTPMEHCPANVSINWRRAFGGRSYPLIRVKEINIFIGPYTTTEPTLARRVMINRCRLDERDKIAKIINSPINGVRGTELRKKINDYLGRDIFGWQDDPILPYLSSYIDASIVGRKIFREQP